MSPSGLVARKLEDAALVIVASPAYLRGRRKPRTAEDLQRHECLPFVQPNTGQPVPWLICQDGRIVELLPEWGGASRPFSLLYSADRHKPLRVRVLIEYLVAKLSTR